MSTVDSSGMLKPSRPPLVSPKELAAQEERRAQAHFHRIIVERDHHKCTACGRRREELAGVYPDLRMLIADHITPKKYGGSDTLDNGQTFCFFCNSRFGWRARYKEAETEEEQNMNLQLLARYRAAQTEQEQNMIAELWTWAIESWPPVNPLG